LWVIGNRYTKNDRYDDGNEFLCWNHLGSGNHNSEKRDKINSASMSIKDILDSSGLNIDYNKVLSTLNTAISNSVNPRDWKDILLEDMDKERVLTIKNPERLNGKGLTITKGWNIEYQGRDLSLTEDNYRWDIWSDYSGERGYYIVQRNLINGNWLNVRWGKVPVNVKERREMIDKSRLKDKERIQTDMIQAINHSIGFKDFKIK